MLVIFDSSTLILLAKIDVLRRVADEVEILIPPKVRSECLAKDTFDARMINAMIKEAKILVRKTASDKAVRKLISDFRIERGEAEALWLAKMKNSPLGVDDGPTIRACKVLNQQFTTAVHFLLRLRSIGYLDAEAAMVKLEKLDSYGRYSRRIAEDATRRIREGKAWE